MLRYGVDGLAAYEHFVYGSDRFSLLRNDLRISILTPAVAEERGKRNVDFAVRKAFPLTPCDIIGDAAAFFLRKAAHNGQEQFALTVERPDVFLLKVHLHATLFQLADRGKAVHRVSGKAADRFGDDEIYLPGKSICHHAVEAFPVLGIQCADTLVRIDPGELPVGVGADVLGVVVHLCLVGGQLFLAVCGHTGITGDSALFSAVHRQLTVFLLCCRDHGDISHCVCSFPAVSAAPALSSHPSSFLPWSGLSNDG